MTNSNSSAVSQRPHRRHLRNYLLHKRFQLKYTAWLVGVTVVLSVSLGTLLLRTTNELVQQSRDSVRRGQQLVTTGRELATESRKVSAVVRMNIIRVPDYADNPELAAAFAKDSDAQEARITVQQQAAELGWVELKAQAESLERQKKQVLYAVFGLLTLLVLGVGGVGIVATHKVAGPLFKMKRQLAEIAAGRLPKLAPLRRGDDLWDFFDVMTEAIQAMRSREQRELEDVERVLGAVDVERDHAKEILRRTRDEKRARLASESMEPPAS